MADQTADAGVPISNMSYTSMRSMVHHLSDPRLIVKDLPIFRHSFFSCKSTQSETLLPSSNRFVSWKSLFSDTSEVGPFNDLFNISKFSRNGQVSGFPRVIFFGEQHHEPSVLRSQLQLLSTLHQFATDASENSASGKQYQLHLVLEHFSILDQDLLNAFAHSKLNDQELSYAYDTKSEEGFSINHYLPLLKLARELGVPIWGGFPPRRWAKLVNREGIEAAQAKEDERSSTINKSTVYAPVFKSWDSVTNLSPAHKSYLSSLRNPRKAPLFPKSMDVAEPRNSTQRELYTEFERQGFHPAQALKDAYLAHVTSWILRSHIGDNHANIVLVICGLGHCEYGFGAPERLVTDLQTTKGSADLRSLRPYIIASKPEDSGIWLGDEAKVSMSGQYEDSSYSNAKLEVREWLENPWNRRLADAVVLYQ